MVHQKKLKKIVFYLSYRGAGGVSTLFLRLADLLKDRYEIYIAYIANVIQHEKVLRISYEDIVNRYEYSVSKIFSFLGIENNKHLSPKSSFNPNISKKNIAMWKDLRFKKWWPDFIKIEESCNEHLS